MVIADGLKLLDLFVLTDGFDIIFLVVGLEDPESVSELFELQFSIQQLFDCVKIVVRAKLCLRISVLMQTHEFLLHKIERFGLFVFEKSELQNYHELHTPNKGSPKRKYSGTSSSLFRHAIHTLPPTLL